MRGVFRRRLPRHLLVEAGGGRRRTKSVVAISSAAVVALVTGAAVVGFSGAAVANAPENVVQVVQVGLGTDGSIKSVQRSDLARAKTGGDYHTSKASLDPSKVAADLPIGVSTLWSRNGQVGSDLADVGGKSGEIGISFTVSDLTVAPKSVGLVGTPYTVIVRAVVPKKSVLRDPVAASAPGSTTPPAVVTTLSNGDYQLQWATILAPPTLPQAATFAFSVDASKFALKNVSVSATPGESTDPSLASLIDQQFGTNGATSPLLTLEGSTSNQINKTVAQLDAIRGKLVSLQGGLAKNAASGGEKVKGQLATGKSDVTNSVSTLQGQLTDLSSNLSAILDSSEQDTNATLADAVRSVIAQLGVDPTGNALPGSGSVYAQLTAIASTLQQASRDSANELAAAQTSISDQIGAAVASIRTANRYLDAVTSSLQTAITDDLGPAGAALFNVKVELGILADAVGTVQCETTTLADSVKLGTATTPCASGAEPSAGADLDSIAADLSTVVDALTGNRGQVATLARDLSTAQSTVTHLLNNSVDGTTTDAAGLATSLADQADNVEVALCGIATAPGDPDELAVAAATKAAGITCQGPAVTDPDPQSDPAHNSLKTNATTNKANVTQLIADSDNLFSTASGLLDSLKTNHGGLGDDVRQLASDIGSSSDSDSTTILGAINAVSNDRSKLSALVGGITGPDGLLHQVDALLAATQALGSTDATSVQRNVPSDACSATPHPNGAAAPAAPAPTATNPLNALVAQVGAACGLIGWGLSDLASASASLASGVGSIVALPTTLGSAESSISAGLSKISTNLSSELTDAATAEVSQGSGALQSAAAGLTAQQSNVGTHLANAVEGNTQAFGAKVKHDNDGLTTARTALTNNLDEVARTLGTSTSGGLFQQVAAAGTGVVEQAGQVGLQGDQSSAYSGVRATEIFASNVLRNEQQAGIQQVNSASPIGEALPDKSSCSIAEILTLPEVK